MSKYIFKSIKDPDNKFDISEITFEVDSVDRAEVIEQFIRFLQAVGYSTKDLEEEFGI